MTSLQPSSAARAAAERWRLRVRWNPRGGAVGDQGGLGTGTSMEFHDRRAYQPGDDVRHMDWRAMARTGEALVRVHREEVSPRVDLLVDTTASMAIDDEKRQRTVDLTGFFALASQSAGLDVRVHALGNRVERVEVDRLLESGLELDADRPLPDVLPEALGGARPQSLRVLISDFLVPHSPDSLVKHMASRAGDVLLIQVLGEFDAEPRAEGALRMTDAESGSTRDVVLERQAIARYLERLERLTAGLVEASQRVGGRCHVARSDRRLDESLEALAQAGVLE